MPPQDRRIPRSAIPGAGNSNSINAGSRPQPPATILLVSPFTEDHNFFGLTFAPPHWRAHHACGYHEALTCLMRDRITVIICESQLPDGDWKDILSQAQVLSEPPRVVVTSTVASGSLWAEVLNLGGYDLLLKPFVREEVLRVAEMAAMSGQSVAEGSVGQARKPLEEETGNPAGRAKVAQAWGGF